jgi:hypothetical protein
MLIWQMVLLNCLRISLLSCYASGCDSQRSPGGPFIHGVDGHQTCRPASPDTTRPAHACAGTISNPDRSHFFPICMHEYLLFRCPTTLAVIDGIFAIPHERHDECMYDVYMVFFVVEKNQWCLVEPWRIGGLKKCQCLGYRDLTSEEPVETGWLRGRIRFGQVMLGSSLGLYSCMYSWSRNFCSSNPESLKTNPEYNNISLIP